MNYSQQYEYLTFLAERTTQQVRMERIINEAVLIGEGADTIENIELIQESFSESVKKVIHKLLTFIGKLWGKFIEAMNTLIKNDKAYLERYKDIILKKKPADDIIIYDYYNGGIQLLLNNSCPQLTDQDINAEEGKSVLDDKNTFITQRFRDFTKFGKGPFDSITDLATAAFRGGGDEVSKVAANVNMTDMYNYCINYGSLKDKIQRDINAFQEAQKKFDSKLASMNNNNELKQQQQEQHESALSIFEGRKYYSAIFEQYITEADDKDKNNEPPVDNNNAMEQAAKEGKKEQEQQDKANAAKQQQQNQNNNNNNATVNNGNTAANYQQNTKDNADANVEQNKNTYNTLQERAKVYFEIGGQYFAAKLTVAQEAEKKFMEVIKNHVRHYVGTKDKDDDQAAKGNTNLNLPNNNNNNQQPQQQNATPDNGDGNTNNQDQNGNK